MNQDESRAKENQVAKEFKAQIDCVIKAVKGRLGTSELDQIKEFNSVGEYKLAVEALLCEIVHDNIALTPGEQDILVKLGRRMRVEAELLAPFDANY